MQQADQIAIIFPEGRLNERNQRITAGVVKAACKLHEFYSNMENRAQVK